MTSRMLTATAALSMLEIPFPEENDMSDYESDGYIDPDENH